jgi:uncharacterized phosphosugar-binding protein
MDSVQQYLSAIATTQQDAISRAADIAADAIAADGQLYLFGTGHSHMLAEEGFYRAGGLAPVCPILASGLMLHEGGEASTALERTSGVAAAVLGRYRPTAKDALMVFSNSGVNAAPVEMALAGKAVGMPVIAVVALAYAAQVKTGPTGKKLADVADVVLDNQGVPGDALVNVGGGLRVGPLSTIAGAFLLNAVLTEAAVRLTARGIQPPVYISANMPGAREHNAALFAKYRTRNPHL